MELHHYPVLESTQTFAKENTHLVKDQIIAISAEHQTGGVTRTGKSPWISPKGENVTLSFISVLPKEFPASHNAAQILALSTAKTVQHFGLTPSLKWPNDILLQGKKVAGILADLATRNKKIYLVNGVGLNVHSKEDTLPVGATSMALLAAAPLTVKGVMETVMAQYEVDHALFLKEGFTPFYDLYKELLELPPLLHFHIGRNKVVGRFHSLAENGTLNLELEDGTIRNCTCIE